jgi:uncharacterized protein HemX
MRASAQMRRAAWLLATAAALALAAGPLATVQAQNSQQAKMTSCNADAKAKGLSGDDRKAFMKSCLSKSATTATPVNSQQQKMKDCNAQATAKSLKGTDRKSFMSTCLKGSGSATS